VIQPWHADSSGSTGARGGLADGAERVFKGDAKEVT
jgi:hypothetical protein